MVGIAGVFLSCVAREATRGDAESVSWNTKRSLSSSAGAE
jgi:hypothetical protein